MTKQRKTLPIYKSTLEILYKMLAEKFDLYKGIYSTCAPVTTDNEKLLDLKLYLI